MKRMVDKLALVRSRHYNQYNFFAFNGSLNPQEGATVQNHVQRHGCLQSSFQRKERLENFNHYQVNNNPTDLSVFIRMTL